MTTDPTLTSEQQIPAWTSTVGPGWAALLDRLHRGLSALDPAYRIEEFTTRLGGLRITVADRFEDGEFDGEFADRTTALTDAAMVASEHTCEDCGAPGRIRFRGDGAVTWMRCLCDECRTRPRAIAPAAGRCPASS
ncbi:hypothetical protein [Streptomyces graminilatus]|uniref:hypothetical protein n=1 Tax=Streptomyces graminilatus TaxID=1464070 RepID=UPI0012FEEABD|nr:hypothetical protein [Streptomyces graminilatus]